MRSVIPSGRWLLRQCDAPFGIAASVCHDMLFVRLHVCLPEKTSSIYSWHNILASDTLKRVCVMREETTDRA